MYVLFNGSFTLHGTGNGTGNNGVYVFCYVLFTLHRDRDRDRDRERERGHLGSIPIFPFPVPVPCSVNEPLVLLYTPTEKFSSISINLHKAQEFSVSGSHGHRNMSSRTPCHEQFPIWCFLQLYQANTVMITQLSPNDENGYWFTIVS